MRDVPRDTFALVLAGGNGTRLSELTRWQRCKPAIPSGGHFRNIDFTLSNCVNSGVRRIAVLTQYKAQGSLLISTPDGISCHARRASFSKSGQLSSVFTPGWYAGTADAVFQNLDLVLARA